MTLHLLSADHRTQGLEAVARLGTVAAHAEPDLRRAVPGLDGVLILSTCNRVAIVLDAPDGRPVEALRDAVAAFLAERAGAGGPVPLSAWSGHAAHLELFATAAGLTSMVVGEREIAGQLRRALTSATAEGTATGAITRAVEHASAASRRVAVRTSLASTGRSVVSVALDLAASRMPPLDGASVLVVGTGAYAGAAVTALRERGASDIEVYSRSERAGPFAAGHAVRAVEEADLPGRLARADLIITCRGLGGPVLTRELLAPVVRRRRPAPPHVREKAGPLVVLDLALSRDVERAVGSLPGVELIDLPAVQRAVPDVEASQVGAARRIVAQEVASFERAQAGRRMDPVVRRLRSGVEGIVEEEVARMRTRDGAVDAEEAARALHHLAARLLHHPTVAVRRAGETGREQEYLEALDLVLGPEVAAGLRGDTEPPAVCPAREGGRAAQDQRSGGGPADLPSLPDPHAVVEAGARRPEPVATSEDLKQLGLPVLTGERA